MLPVEQATAKPDWQAKREGQRDMAAFPHGQWSVVND